MSKLLWILFWSLQCRNHNICVWSCKWLYMGELMSIYISFYMYICISRMGKKNLLAQYKRPPDLTGTFWSLLYYKHKCFAVLVPGNEFLSQKNSILPVQILLIQMLKFFRLSSSVFYLYVKGQICQCCRIQYLFISSPVILDGEFVEDWYFPNLLGYQE